MSFSARILDWYHDHKRALPWRETKNPYIIWLSEIILQQTRVEQGTPYFFKFVEEYPNVTKFAAAEQASILRLWQGLGYYSRARNMHKAAKQVVDLYDGIFPTHYKDLLSLPGVGQYTAAAIASFSENHPHAVVDGNVFRVLSRYFGIEEPINSTAGKKLFSKLADELLDRVHPGEYNQAMMDFGAMQCKPKNPDCSICPLQVDCVAYGKGLQAELPKKLKGKKSRNRYFHYFVLERDGEVMMSQRPEGDVWTNLFEFPMLETSEMQSHIELQASAAFRDIFGDAQLRPIVGMQKHVLSHQNIYASFYKLENIDTDIAKKSNWNYYLLENLDKLAKHKLISSFVERYF